MAVSALSLPLKLAVPPPHVGRASGCGKFATSGTQRHERHPPAPTWHGLASLVCAWSRMFWLVYLAAFNGLSSGGSLAMCLCLCNLVLRRYWSAGAGVGVGVVCIMALFLSMCQSHVMSSVVP